MWASSQLAWTCCSAWRMGVWLKTRGRRKGQQGGKNSQRSGSLTTVPRGDLCPAPTRPRGGLSQGGTGHARLREGGQHTVLLGVGQVETQVVQVLQDLLQSQLGQLAAGAPQAARKSRGPDLSSQCGLPECTLPPPPPGPSCRHTARTGRGWGPRAGRGAMGSGR